MLRPRFQCLFVVLAVSASVAPAVAKDVKKPSTTTPIPGEGKWMTRHVSIGARVKQGNFDLLMIGDEITGDWEATGKPTWDQYYAKRNALNLGFLFDGTQHVLWRMDNGNIDGLSPKLAVLMIGTNNSGLNTPAEIAAGVKAIVGRLRSKLPKTKVLVLAIFPRGADDKDPRRQVNMKANALIAKFADNRMVYFLDIGSKFLQPDGTLSREMMHDLRHPTAKGYAIWAEAMEPTVAKLMGEKK